MAATTDITGSPRDREQSERSRGAARGATRGGLSRLVIVESPAKAKTIAGYLGRGYVVESSIGHIRDLPKSAADVPSKYKKEPWARLGVDVEHGFEPLYVVDPGKRDQVKRLKRALDGADELWIATDEDREGEAIAWHLLQVLQPRVPVHRMVFHEITPQAIDQAVAHPRELDRALVDAQETRRILDRLYGYEVSPVLWKKVMPRLSAGRVQSVATRMLVDRERARMAFRAAAYWDIEGTFLAAGDEDLSATLVAVDGRRVATGRDFDSTGRLTAAELVHLDEPAARGLADRLGSSPFAVRRVEDKPYRRRPPAPFMTSTLQQEASRKLRFTGQRTMRVAQSLYEGGYITYMRTDSTTLSRAALAAARAQARELYGADAVPEAPRRYEKKVKNAQEAHEAIRPSGDTFRTPAQVEREVGRDEARLYELVWQRTVASQMVDATGRSVSLRLGGTSSAGEDAEFAASGTIITTPGWLRAYSEGTDGDDDGRGDRDRRLPDVAEGDRLDTRELTPAEHATTPPARYTDATLVRALEEAGVGRPSTYAAIITTIIDRGYVSRKGSALVPSFTAFAVVGLLEQYFARLVDYDFTARLEDQLDDIASGEQESVPWLTAFYFGTPDDSAPKGRRRPDDSAPKGRRRPDDSAPTDGLKAMVSERLGEIDAREVNSIPLGDDDAGRQIVVRVGRYGPYLQRGDDRASLPDDTVPDELTLERAGELLDAPSGDKVLGSDPDSGLDVLARTGRFGPYVTLALPEGSPDKPKTASLLRSQSIDALSLDDALALLSLPRSLGADPDTGEEVLVRHGRYGPYVTRGSDSRSLESEEALFTLDLAGAQALFAQPKRRGRAASSAPLRELGEDPGSGNQVVVKDGRFGPYVTDGEINASLRKGDAPDTITLERAGELLAERRAKGPAPKSRRTAKKTAKKSTAKKSTAKKSTAKKATKKAAKKPPARKR